MITEQDRRISRTGTYINACSENSVGSSIRCVREACLGLF
jgi:hypothetical protein